MNKRFDTETDDEVVDVEKKLLLRGVFVHTHISLITEVCNGQGVKM